MGASLPTKIKTAEKSARVRTAPSLRKVADPICSPEPVASQGLWQAVAATVVCCLAQITPLCVYFRQNLPCFLV